jgi:excisionase family DNA binding protein
VTIERRSEAAPEPLLSVGEVAVYLGLSVAATKRIVPSELPFSRISARNDRRYSRADVDRYVESRKVVE